MGLKMRPEEGWTAKGGGNRRGGREGGDGEDDSIGIYHR